MTRCVFPVLLMAAIRADVAVRPVASSELVDPSGADITRSQKRWVRKWRVEQAQATLDYIRNNFDLVRSMLAGSRLIYGSTDSVSVWEPGTDSAKVSDRHVPFISHQEGTVLDVAREIHERTDQKAVVVNAASAYHVGGGFTNGGRHALEESMCMQSTLYVSLYYVFRTGEKKKIEFEGKHYEQYIPENAAVLSPNVHIFREGTYHMPPYEFLDQPTAIAAVVSVAMPNLNSEVSDSPLANIERSAPVYTELLQQKWRATLRAAKAADATYVVVPAAGCGVFKNEPVQVGKALGAVFRSEFYHDFEGIVVVGKGESEAKLYSALEEVVGAVWQFSAHGGKVWKDFEFIDSGIAETAYQTYKLYGASPQVTLMHKSLRGILATIDFPSMKQGGRNVRR
eukprot:CAMPEP_0117525758 /NCGR_PEP_ID=MMETSP0784-20121206/35937_1 /TAXON_ID=39447 /ORGANISM="" /LENGTH=396 /DNA_ID=CAMNT_0005321969 /DNA_START=1 /DNA_END=1188 /DNA_ORIENTATION=+